MMAKSSNRYVIELDGVLYESSENNLKQIVDLKDLKGDYLFLSDMQEAVSRVMTVEAPVKYVEVIIRKQLQESGEFDSPVAVITHWKKKKRQNTTDIFFTAVPASLFHNYIDQVKELEDNILLFPLYMALLGALNHIRHKGPVAVIFQHSRFADLIIGTKKRVYYANRCVAFDDSDEQILSLWNTAITDIKTVEEENRIKVAKAFLINWVDSGVLPDWPEDEEIEICPLEEEQISFHEEIKSTSLLKVLGRQTGIKSISTPVEKTWYFANKWAFSFNILFLLAALILIIGSFWNNQRANFLETQAQRLTREMDGVQVQAPLAVSGKGYEGTLSFVKNLALYQKCPSYKKVINDISDFHFSDMKLEVLKLDYSAEEIHLEIFGNIISPFNIAYKGYQNLLFVLKQKGYIVNENRFDTQIRNSQFLLKLTKKIK